MQEYFVKRNEIRKLFRYLPGAYDVCVIDRKDGNLFWKKFDPQKADEVIVSEHRPTEPLKSFLFKPKEKVLDQFKDYESKKRPLAIVGAKACDLRALKVMDYVFAEGDFKDPFYAKMREENLIISADCTSFKDVCFCLA